MFELLPLHHHPSWFEFQPSRGLSPSLKFEIAVSFGTNDDEAGDNLITVNDDGDAELIDEMMGSLYFADPATQWLVAIVELSDAIVFWLIIILGMHQQLLKVPRGKVKRSANLGNGEQRSVEPV